MRFRAFYPLVFSCAALMTVGACTKHEENPAGAPVIKVNGEGLTAQDFSQRLAKRLKSFDALAAKDPTNLKRTKEDIIKEFVVTSLIRQFAQEHKLEPTDDEVTAEFDRIRRGYPDDISFRASLAAQGLTPTEWKQKLKENLTETKAFEFLTPPPDSPEKLQEQAKAYFQAHSTEFQRPAQVHLKQILISKKDDAERLLKKVKSGGSFEETAKHYSISPEALQGGDLGYVSKGLEPAFDTAFNMHPGQISNVIKSNYGFHILKLIDKRAAGSLTFEQVKDRILLHLKADRQQTAFKAWLEEALKKNKVERNDTLINKIKVYTEGAQE